MGYEVEFHPVGDATRAGDAITIRYGKPGAYLVMVVDGGTDDTGELLVEHIRTYYGADTVLTDVVSTHPDTDHSCGLRALLDAFPVERLWIHGLWHHAQDLLPLFSDTRWTAEGLAEAIRKEYPIVDDLISKAFEKDTEVFQPFAGARIGPFTVLSPTQWAYQHLVPQFRKTPDPNETLLRERNMWLSPKKGFAAFVERMVEAAKSLVKETWEHERLKDGGVTAAENESSVVMYGAFDEGSILLTADAGVNALWWACDHADTAGIDLRACSLVQVPHHGSRRNVGPSVLNRLLGPILPKGSAEQRKAIASVPKDDEKHPRRIVMNAFLRRGVGVRKTQGEWYRLHANMPTRANEGTAQPFSFFDEVEEYD